MIKTINMKNCASYDDEGISICNCNKVNYIYGHNGSGKSTISNYLQTPSLAQFGDCSIEWELGTEAEVLVYNKNFRLKNLQSMPGVFTLGEATAEQIKHLEELKETKEKRRNELLTLKNNIQEKENEKKRLNESFEKDAWDTILKKNEEVFLDAFTGLRGKKSLFAGKVLSVYKKKPTTEFTREELVEKAKTLFAKKPDLLSEITIPDVASLYEIETNEIWGKVIIGNNDVDMAALMNALHNSDWVKAGMKYISDDGVCPFCQKKTVDKIVIEQLNQFFSGEYERQNRIVEGLCNQYRTITSALLEQICEWVNTAKAQPIEFDLSELEAYCKAFELLIGKNVELFESKKTEPSRCIDIDLSSDVSTKMLEVMKTYNAKIKEHNKLVDDYALQKKKLIEDIWALLIDENSLLLKTYTEADGRICKALIGMSAKEKSLSDEIERLNNEIVEESKNVTSVQPTVDAINRSLKAYGFEGFEIVASKERPNQYQIMRPNGVIATDSLSEGEETFISFLYFVYMTRGGLNTDDIGTHKVIVVDDPICSLDSSILYVVSSLVRELTDYAKKGTNNIDQVFILTHNVYFHKEVSFMDGRDKTDNKVSFWTLQKKNEISTVKSYNNKNPITTSYALLWKEVKNSDSISSVSLQNAMRRILENFFGTLGNANFGDILKCFASPEEQSICRSLFSWTNDGSHSIPDDLEFSEDNDSSEKFKKVFRDVFYNTHNQYHYDRMME